jgi:hypothetical protein
MPVILKRYEPALKSGWNQAVRRMGGHFMFEREFMDYHADRFEDFSWVVADKARIVGLFPANRRDDCLESHGGLTFGGLLHGAGFGGSQVMRTMEALLVEARAAGFRRISYKALPWIYYNTPNGADGYALFRLGFKLERRELSSVVDLTREVDLSKGRRHSLSKARKAALRAEASDDYEGFSLLLAGVLEERHRSCPVHTGAEIRLLSERFPRNIVLLGVKTDGAWVAGGWLFFTGHVCHTQYLASNAHGRKWGAMDALIVEAIKIARERQCRYLSLGPSTLDAGRFLNEGLLAFKEMFGASSFCYDRYEVEL